MTQPSPFERVAVSVSEEDSSTAVGSPVQLGPLSYFADFFVYPAFASAFIAWGLVRAPLERGRVALALIAGIAFWTLAEYLLHRFFFHRVPGCVELHEAHHAHQKALIGTPTWITLPIFLAVAGAPSVFALGWAAGGAFTAGMMLGYVWYVAIHYAMHHWKARPDTYFFRLKRRHALHHHYDDMGNFGVTTGFWDYVFRTNVIMPRQGARH